ncbi:MAG: TonB-dependent receptor [Ignavibacteriaceae bacterium]
MMTKLKLQYLLPILCFALLFSVPVLSQTSGKIAGQILDETGTPLPFVNIILEGTTQGSTTDYDGYYSIINVQAGTYKVKFTYIGYKTLSVENVRVSADQTKTLNMELTPQVIEGEEVIVVAKKPILEHNQTSSIVSINKDDIKNLPLQGLNDIVNLQAGVVDGHFRGGRIGEVQYQVDGVSVNNPYNNSSILNIDKSILEEVQVISGTFDAKYGQAMSGVVNAVLRSGGSKFEFSGEAYGGDYFTTDNQRYPNNGNFTPYNLQNYQLTLSGPLGLPQTTFLVSGRRYLNDGYLFGERRFLPTDSSDFEKKIYNPSGDGEIVPMSTTREWSGQFKLSNTSISSFNLSYQATYNYAKRKNYNHDFRFNPDGTSSNTSVSLSHGFGITHTVSENIYHKLNIRQNYFSYTDFAYEDLYDPAYISSGAPKGDDNYEYGAVIQGVDLTRFKQITNNLIAKWDFTYQAGKHDLIEFGIDGQISEMTFGSPGFFISTVINDVQTLQPREEMPRIPGLRTYNPRQFSSYLQDRMELGDLTLRAGVRWEYFDANTTLPSDFQNPANTITGAPKSELVKTKVKSAFAPRLGFSFPLTTASSVYFSYGHFYQLPGLGLLYSNADYSILDELQAGGISYGVMGNPDLKPELTVQYECGFKQSIGEMLGVELSFFYKDIRDLLGVEFVSTYAAADYGKFTNIDFGGVYGVILALSQRNIGNLSTSLDYTLQFAEGNSSDPRETANRAAAGKDSRPRVMPFGWDQRHTLNASLVYFVPDDYSVSTIIRFGSGQPYTPELGYGFTKVLETNSGSKNTFVLVDLRAEKYFDIGPLNLSLFLRVFNLFNQHFANGFVFSSTGSPDYTLTPSTSISTLIDPSRFYEPRRIEFGISFRSK